MATAESPTFVVPPSPVLNGVTEHDDEEQQNGKRFDYMPDKLLPPKRNREANSTHRLSRLDVQRASTEIKRFVQSRLETDLNVIEVRKRKMTE